MNRSLFIRLHFTIGCYNGHLTSWCRHGFQFSGIQIHFADHVHRRSGVYNKISFLWFKVDGEGKHQFSESEKNVVLCFFFNFKIHLAFFHAASRAYRSCLSVSCWDRCSNFGALEDHLGKLFQAMFFWSRMLAWRNTALANWTRRIGFNMFELFRKIVVDFGGSISWNTQPNCRVFFKKATAILSPFFLDFLLGCSRQPIGVRKRIYPQICIHFLSCSTSTAENAIFHKIELCEVLWGNPCTAIEPFRHLGFCL